MIASVTGSVQAIRGDLAVLEVGGVGLAVQCTPRTLMSLRTGKPATLHTSLVVREDSLTLFGFASEDERYVFEILQTATGVGPRVAQSVLATHEPDAVRLAVANGDVKALTLVPGIGSKGAQRMLVELKDRLAGTVGDVISMPPQQESEPPIVQSVREGLLQLGTKPQDADEALRAALKEVPATDAATLLRAALRMLAPR